MTALLNINAAQKSYKDVMALKGINFEVNRGEITTLIGPNGAGKSTLIKCITTLETLDDGQIKIEETDVTLNAKEAREAIGYAGQDAALDKILTAREFLHFQGGIVHLPKRKIKTKVEELLLQFNLLNAADRHIETYSGGMKKRLELAAAIMHNPKLLILDEPSSGLDYDSRRELWQILLGLKIKGTGMLIATHDFEEAEALSDKTILISKGQIVGEGSPKNLKTKLGEWVLSASVNKNINEEGDCKQKLAQLFKSIPGKELPRNPQLAEVSKILPFNTNKKSNWHDYLNENAKQQELSLHSISMRKPTLADAYLYHTSITK